MNEQALRFRVGVFVLASLILMAVLVILFGGLPSIFKRANEYTLVFPGGPYGGAPGVGPGTPVRKSGVRIGEVQSVRLDDVTGEVDVKIAIDRSYTIRENDRPTLVHGLLGGDTSIDFIPGPAPLDEKPADEKHTEVPGKAKSSEPSTMDKVNGAEEAEPPAPPPAVPPGSRIQGTAQSDARQLINDISRIMPMIEQTVRRFSRLAPEIDRTVREYRSLAQESRETLPAIRKTNEELFVAFRYWSRVGERIDALVQTNQDKMVKALDNFNDAIVRIGNLFSDENQRAVNETLKNLRRGTENLDSLTKNTDEFIKEGRQTLKRVNDSIKETDDVLNNLQRATKPMADRSAAIMHNLDESTARLNALLRAFQDSNGTLGALLNDPTLYRNLNDVACMLRQMMPRLDRAMQDMELFADKIARHPESLGLGGVVTPGSGLKR